ncbi:MAG: hypothetical protein WA432_01595 [Candidatus Babeliaceae bacterium]
MHFFKIFMILFIVGEFEHKLQAMNQDRKPIMNHSGGILGEQIIIKNSRKTRTHEIYFFGDLEKLATLVYDKHEKIWYYSIPPIEKYAANCNGLKEIIMQEYGNH